MQTEPSMASCGTVLRFWNKNPTGLSKDEKKLYAFEINTRPWTSTKDYLTPTGALSNIIIYYIINFSI